MFSFEDMKKFYEFVDSLGELVRIYKQHDHSVNDKLDQLIVELKELNAKMASKCC